MSSDKHKKQVQNPAKKTWRHNVTNDNNKKPLKAVPKQHVAADIHKHEKEDSLILADGSSGYAMSKKLTNISTARIMNQLKHWFNLLGWPQTLNTHGGPHFQKTIT